MLLRYSTYPAHRHSDSRSICRMARKLSATTCSPISGTGTSILGSDCCRARMVLGTEVAMIEWDILNGSLDFAVGWGVLAVLFALCAL
ncbi:hypothetical protein DTO006G1_3300 [Penicillium roqueforti]|uniref:uncharacterized protein n=1 Tax=Penicillium roqueforti TaxID=5082 RepID=UPI0019091D90|nr:uncharacterized protein LCP9604111_6230 [Penicillium roqueforti]KAF9247531.1 hypothetical protein LCP9604111_6230 [Penicillium roqueforti]KAI1834871.1 hypothetical protein CBS147337_4425 [Penicillium roqueforti]KAI2703029.1 hypothetical protein CBS147372_3344 [Penicillium roqueforti]KAI2712300.1 hypothetical protein CBS147318_7733 [Penicillium roqueforti]KAI2725305.1 hypothetical protein CBS147354_4882 [Penicillium roqueforti]